MIGKIVFAIVAIVFVVLLFALVKITVDFVNIMHDKSELPAIHLHCEVIQQGTQYTIQAETCTILE